MQYRTTYILTPYQAEKILGSVPYADISSRIKDLPDNHRMKRRTQSGSILGCTKHAGFGVWWTIESPSEDTGCLIRDLKMVGRELIPAEHSPLNA